MFKIDEIKTASSDNSGGLVVGFLHVCGTIAAGSNLAFDFDFFSSRIFSKSCTSVLRIE